MKSLMCLVNHFESSQNNVSLKEWEFLKASAKQAKDKYGIILKDEVDLHLWQKVVLGTNLVELFYEGSIDKFRVAVDIAELGEIHNSETIAKLRLKVQ